LLKTIIPKPWHPFKIDLITAKQTHRNRSVSLHEKIDHLHDQKPIKNNQIVGKNFRRPGRQSARKEKVYFAAMQQNRLFNLSVCVIQPDRIQTPVKPFRRSFRA